MLREVAAFEKDRPAANWLTRMRQAWRRTPVVAWTGALALVTLLAAGGTQFYPRQTPPPTAASITGQPQPAAPDAVPAQQPAPSGEVADVPADPSPTMAAAARPAVTAQDVEVIADLDNVLSREESRLWTEDDTARY